MSHVAIAAVFFVLGLCYGRFWRDWVVVRQGRRRRTFYQPQDRLDTSKPPRGGDGTCYISPAEDATLRSEAYKADAQNEPGLSTEPQPLPSKLPKLGKKAKRKGRSKR